MNRPSSGLPILTLPQLRDPAMQAVVMSSVAPMSLETAIQVMATTLNDPTGPQASCCCKLNAAAEIFNRAAQRSKTIAEAQKFAGAYPQVLRAVLRFCTKKQSAEAHSSMIHQMITTCRGCDEGRGTAGWARMHMSDHRDPRVDYRVSDSAIIYSCILLVVDCLTTVLATLSQGKYRARKRDEPDDEKQPWPQGLEDVLPHGPIDSVDGIELWVADKNNGYHMYRVLAGLVRAHPAFGAQILSRGPDYRLAIQWPAQHINAGVELYRQRSPSWRTPSQDDTFFFPINLTFTYLSLLGHGGGESRLCDLIVERGKPGLLAALVSLLKVLSEPGMPEMYSEERFRAYLYAMILDSSLHEELLPFTQGLIHPSESTRWLAFANAHAGGCHSATCPLDESGTVAHAQLCANCRLVRYCSRKCQADSWKDQKHPHKVVCSKIKAFREKIGQTNWNRMWKLRFSSADFLAICHLRGVDLRIVDGIATELSAVYLVKEKKKALKKPLVKP